MEAEVEEAIRNRGKTVKKKGKAAVKGKGKVPLMMELPTNATRDQMLMQKVSLGLSCYRHHLNSLPSQIAPCVCYARALSSIPLTFPLVHLPAQMPLFSILVHIVVQAFCCCGVSSKASPAVRSACLEGLGYGNDNGIAGTAVPIVDIVWRPERT